MILRKELQPGSREPAGPNEVDFLLTFVPELSFFPPLEPGVPALDPGPGSHEAVDASQQCATASHNNTPVD